VCHSREDLSAVGTSSSQILSSKAFSATYVYLKYTSLRHLCKDHKTGVSKLQQSDCTLLNTRSHITERFQLHGPHYHV